MRAQPLGILLLWLPLCSTAVLAQTGTSRPPTQLSLTGTLPPELAEASGVATSRQHDGVFWVHNDSGHRPWLYAIDEKGEVQARFLVPEVRATDWEDIAIGPCLRPAQGPSCLFIADTGDNNRSRQTVSVLVVPEPNPSDPVRSTVPPQVVRLRLLRGPTDIEAIAVSPTGEIFLFSKGWEGRVFVFVFSTDEARIAVEGSRPLDLRSVGQLSIGPTRTLASQVTGAAFSKNGRRIVVRTYQTLFFYELVEGLPLPVGPACRMGAVEPQGEAVDFIDDHTLIAVSESLSNYPATVYIVRCP